MRMYPKNDLYQIYKKHLHVSRFSDVLQDVTKKITLEHMNYAINVADKWDHCMDIGGGTGHYLAPLATKFKKATLVEVEDLPEHKQLTKDFTNISIFHEYIEKYQNPEKVDFILLADLFEHIPDIKSFVEKMSSLQNVGGVVYMITPNSLTCGPAPESGLYHTRHPNGHIKQYTGVEIIKLMEAAGYDLIAHLYEETPLRQRTKHFIYALSRRDKKMSNFLIYHAIRPLLLIFALVIFKVLEKMTYASEKRNRHNPLNTLAQDLIFKKIR